jgi:hypothetical protein
MIDLSLQFPASQTDDSDPTGYPYDAFQNVTVDGDDTGTPIVANIMNDIYGYKYAVLDAAGLTPTNVPDKVGVSDHLEATKIVNGLSVQTAADLLNEDPSLLPVGMGAKVTNDSYRTGEWVIAAWTSEVDNNDTIKVNGTWSSASKYWKRSLSTGNIPGTSNALAAYRIGADDPYTEQHLAFGNDRIVSKWDGTTAGTLVLGHTTQALWQLSSSNTKLTVAGTDIMSVSGGNLYAKGYYQAISSPVMTKGDIYSQYVEDTGGSRNIASSDEGRLTKLTHGSAIEITVNAGVFFPSLYQEMQFWYPDDQLATVTFVAGTNVTIHRNGVMNPGDWVCLKKIKVDGANEEFILCGVPSV